MVPSLLRVLTAVEEALLARTERAASMAVTHRFVALNLCPHSQAENWGGVAVMTTMVVVMGSVGADGVFTAACSGHCGRWIYCLHWCYKSDWWRRSTTKTTSTCRARSSGS